MTIERLLARKKRDVATAAPHRTVCEAARILTDRKIGAVVVVGPGGEIFGILSERDIVRAIAKDGMEALNASISRYMTTRVVCASESDLLEDVMATMSEGRFRHMPVVKDERLVGIVSIGDIVKIRLDVMETEHRAMREYIATA